MLKWRQRSVKYNNLEDRVSIRQGDIKEAVGIFGAASFHVVTCNPPYMIGQHGLTNPHMPKAIARHEILCTLEDVVSQAAKLLGDRGRFYMVHRPFRLTEIMNVLDEIQAGAEAHAAGLSLYRPGAKHGADRSFKRWKFQNHSGKAADRI